MICVNPLVFFPVDSLTEKMFFSATLINEQEVKVVVLKRRQLCLHTSSTSQPSQRRSAGLSPLV
jgi:hypothetical protein